MFRWFKEVFVDSIKEGIAEAKQEIAEEEKQTEHQEEVKSRVPEIPDSEKFSVALAAPFRAVYVSGWSLIFEEEDDADQPLALYSFGESDSVTEAQRKTLRELMSRDFNISGHESALKFIASLLHAGEISDKLAEYANEDLHALNHVLSPDAIVYSDRLQKPLKALMTAMAAHGLTCSTDCGYLEKPFALELLSDITAYAKTNFSGWQDYGDAFLTGEKIAKLNNGLGRKFLSGNMEHLYTKAGSPWKHIEWPPFAQNAQTLSK